ncbi:DUF2167 domain-containing protein [Tropicibacter sp. S64]|uniref:DUF2167 domain-containing protein n=1 Tax=Tropicibacter sp. S64 TaxID=3415122 RepID=UPI003C7BD899
MFDFKVYAFAALAALAMPGLAIAEEFKALFPEIAADAEAADFIGLLDKLDYQTGTVTLQNGIATLEQGDAFYFLGPKDARYVLEDLWGNPEDTTILGMVFPIDATPLHDTWGMVLTFEEIGFVKDEDAEAYDYAALLKDMQADTEAENSFRLQNGYESIKLVGWAEPPHYDKTDRKLYWAKELSFNGSTGDDNTLNYNIRALGRKGVLVMNVVSGMGQLGEVQTDAPKLLAMTSFTEGNRYADFNPDIDTVAAVGIGGLIAGKVLAKTGLIATGLLLLKKFWFLLLIPLAGLKRLFARKES